MIDTSIIPDEYLPSQILSGENGLRAKIVEMFTEKKALLGEGPDTMDIIKRNIRNRIEASRVNIATRVSELRNLNNSDITD
jgi:hypothetical protein